MFLILYIQLPSLQVDMIDVKVVVIELHMDHFLTFLVHFILFKSLVDLIYLALHLWLILHWEKFVDLSFRRVHYLVRMHHIWLLIT